MSINIEMICEIDDELEIWMQIVETESRWTLYDTMVWGCLMGKRGPGGELHRSDGPSWAAQGQHSVTPVQPSMLCRADLEQWPVQEQGVCLDPN